jgi:hypothetical protein
VLTGCSFEGLKTGAACVAPSVINQDCQICGCTFSGCEVGVYGLWRGFFLIECSFIGVLHQACFWGCRAYQIVIDECFFGQPLDGTSVTLSFAVPETVEGGTINRASSIRHSCFRGAGTRVAWATALGI